MHINHIIINDMYNTIILAISIILSVESGGHARCHFVKYFMTVSNIFKFVCTFDLCLVFGLWLKRDTCGFVVTGVCWIFV